jgi:hypothetical protein
MVLVCHEHKFIFLKTRKTAGTSVEMLLEPLCAPAGHTVAERTHAIVSEKGVVGSRLIPVPDNPLHKFVFFLRHPNERWQNHMAASDILKLLGKDRFKEYKKMPTVRNPFALAISQFNWRHRASLPTGDDYVDRFRRFVRDDLPDQKEITHHNDALIVDHAIRKEELQEDLEAFSREAGISLTQMQLPHAKDQRALRSKSPQPVELFDGTTADILRDKLDWMFRLGRYSREVPA